MIIDNELAKKQYGGTKVLAIIPARGGSKGVPRKNIKLLNDKPLIAYTIDVAKECKDVIDRCVVSTEDHEIKMVAQQWGGEVVDRPAELAEDKTKSEPVLTHVVEYLEEKEGYRPNAVLLLSPTCPFRSPEQIREAVNKFFEFDYDTVIGLKPKYDYEYKIDSSNDVLVPQFTERANRQVRTPIWIESGVLYLTKVELTKKGLIFGEKIGYVKTEGDTNINIDTPLDFLMAKNTVESYKT